MPRQTNLPLEVIFARQGRGNSFGAWGLGLLEPGVWSLKLRQGRGVWLWNSFSLGRAEETRLGPGAWGLQARSRGSVERNGVPERYRMICAKRTEPW